MRPRDLERLAESTYDVLIVGGGIHGLAVAYEAASRGLHVALVEAVDLGSGASFNHQKTAHGGLRALQTGHIGRARVAIRERRALARIAPWLLRPFPFILGTYRSVVRSRLAIRALFKLDEWLGRKRNMGLEPELHLPAPRLVSKAATLRLFPGIRPEHLTGGAQWYDYQMVEAERLTMAFAAAADRAGADLANYVEALAPVRENGRITGFIVRDRVTDATFPLKARTIVNAAGSRCGEIMTALGMKRTLPLLKAMNLVTSKRASDIALAAPATDGRMLTLVPWRGRALVGTSQSASLARPEDVEASATEVDGFIAEANHAFPALKLTRSDVTLVHRGVVPASLERDGRAGLRTESQVLDHATDGAAEAISVVGVKYTTARRVAERVTDLLGRKLNKRISPSRTSLTVLPGAGIADHEALAIATGRESALELPPATLRPLIARYAEGAAHIVRLMGGREDLRAPVASGRPTVGAEIVYAIRTEMALTLADIVIRRTGLGEAGHPGTEAVQACARIAAAELGWDAAREAREIAAVDEFYRIEER
jgi:glycerol-3-phosphate dehydrogenase